MDHLLFIKKQSHKLIFWGVLLIILGLLVGLAAPLLANPRMGVSSHIEGVLNGMLLILFGLIWNRINLSVKWLKITWWMVMYGTFMNWFGILIAAVFNGGKMLGIMAGGKQGSPVVEGIIEFSLVSLSIAMIVVCIVVLVGLKRNVTIVKAD